MQSEVGKRPIIVYIFQKIDGSHKAEIENCETDKHFFEFFLFLPKVIFHLNICFLLIFRPFIYIPTNFGCVNFCICHMLLIIYQMVCSVPLHCLPDDDESEKYDLEFDHPAVWKYHSYKIIMIEYFSVFCLGMLFDICGEGLAKLQDLKQLCGRRQLDNYKDQEEEFQDNLQLNQPNEQNRSYAI